MKQLQLSLKKQWFEMTKAGVKSITLQDSLVGLLKKKIEVLESKLKPDSVIIKRSIDGSGFDTINIYQVDQTKYVKVKIVSDCKPVKQ